MLLQVLRFKTFKTRTKANDKWCETNHLLFMSHLSEQFLFTVYTSVPKKEASHVCTSRYTSRCTLRCNDILGRVPRPLCSKTETVLYGRNSSTICSRLLCKLSYLGAWTSTDHGKTTTESFWDSCAYDITIFIWSAVGTRTKFTINSTALYNIHLSQITNLKCQMSNHKSQICANRTVQIKCRTGYRTW